jgi:hypothetical protein
MPNMWGKYRKQMKFDGIVIFCAFFFWSILEKSSEVGLKMQMLFEPGKIT